DFAVSAPCDYGFVPELCPSGPVEVMLDSDEYLAVEMQHHDLDTGRLGWGGLSPAVLARSLAQWTTARHRQNAEVSLIFHAGAVPATVAAVEAAAARFVAEVRFKLRSLPQPHRDHPTWIGMMALQRARGTVATGKGPATGGGAGWTGLAWRLRLDVLG